MAVIDLLPHQHDFCFMDAPYPALVGGLGCVHGGTRIITEKGIMRIDDITQPIRVLSWNEKNQKFQLSLSSGSFLKGVENLYQVSTRNGGFRAAAHHRSFSYSHKFEQVGGLTEMDSLACVTLPRSNLELDQLLLSLDVQNYTQTDEDLLRYYADEARQYGQQLLLDAGIDQASLPLKDDADKSVHSCAPYAFLNKDAQALQKQGHSRLGQSPLLDIVEDNIIKVSEEEGKSPFYDMQVLDTNNYVCADGFIHHNSGKSRAGTMRLILKMAQDIGINTLYAMPTYDLLKLRAITGFEEDLQALGIEYKLNKSDYSIHIPAFGGSIYLRSFDNPNRFIAFEVAHSVLDELDTESPEKADVIFRKVSERTRQNCAGGNTIAVVTTPDRGFAGFVYKKWGKNPAKGFELIKGDTRNNPFLPPGYVEQIMQNYDPMLAEMYISGEFVSLTQSKVYHIFDRKKHHSPRVLLNTDTVIHIGIDFNVGGCASIVYVIDNNKPIAVDEFLSNNTGDMINNLNSRYFGKRCVLYPDASGKASSTNASASDIAMLEAAGFMCDAPNKNPFVRDRVNSVNALFANDGFLVNTDVCQELTLSLESQGYDDKGSPEKFNQHPAIDDWNDAMGYFIHRRYAVNRAIVASNVHVGML